MLLNFLSIAAAARFPAPIALITVAAPDTESPPAYTYSFEVCTPARRNARSVQLCKPCRLFVATAFTVTKGCAPLCKSSDFVNKLLCPTRKCKSRANAVRVVRVVIVRVTVVVHIAKVRRVTRIRRAQPRKDTARNLLSKDDFFVALNNLFNEIFFGCYQFAPMHPPVLGYAFNFPVLVCYRNGKKAA